jgi:hypothetical protein
MRYFIHIVTDSERLRDPDGAEFYDLEAARREASQSARDLMAGELMAGRPVPLGWQAQIADADEVIHLTIRFSALIFGEHDPVATGAHAFRPVTDPDIMARARATMMRAQRQNREIRDGLGQLWSQLRTLARMNADLPTR